MKLNSFKGVDVNGSLPGFVRLAPVKARVGALGQASDSSRDKSQMRK